MILKSVISRVVTRPKLCCYGLRRTGKRSTILLVIEAPSDGARRVRYYPARHPKRQKGIFSLPPYWSGSFRLCLGVDEVACAPVEKMN